MLTRSLIAITCLSAVATAAAQDLTTEITVDRTVVTELPDAEPLKSVFPSIPQLPAADFRLQPAMYNRASAFNPMAGNLKAPLYTGIDAPSGYRGYAFAGYFPAFNAEAALGYRFVNTKATQAGAALSYDGFSYKSKRPVDDTSLNSNTFRTQADVTHRFAAGASLAAAVDYMYAGIKSPFFDVYDKKHDINAFGAHAAVSGGRSIAYSLGVDYSYFGLSGDISQNFERPSDKRFAVNGNVAFGIGAAGNTTLGLGIGADFLNASGYSAAANSYEYVSGTSGIISVNPALRYAGKHVDIKIGATLNFGTNTPEKVFHIAPDIDLCWAPSGAFDAYITADGGERFNDLRWQYEQSVFAPGATVSTRSFTKLRSRIGFNAHILNNFTIGAFTGYGYVKNLPVYALVNVPGINFVNDRANSWYFGGNIGYDLGRMASLNAVARYFAKGSFESADRAHMVLDASLKIYPIKSFSFEAAYSLRARRSYKTVSGYNGDMLGSSLLDITANYAFSERFNAFVSLRNLLNNRCLSTPEVESRPLHGLVGVSYLF
ncbi:MAG: hypothetical protein OSJ37_07650 [Muribaculaceae bacterium]|jgi:hypothetical protein|nr:hypothetical protein [Muribaculaceae bacterium]